MLPNLKVTGAALLYRATSVLTALFDIPPKQGMKLPHQGIGVVIGHGLL